LAYFGGKFVFNLAKSWSLTSLAGAPVESATDASAQTTASVNQSLQSSSETASKPWDGKSRVNILLLGLDTSTTPSAGSSDRTGPARSDTMILVSIDPLSQTIGALSIRRDLLVNIPESVGSKKINMAYYYGEAWNLPGGGPGLSVETVEQLLGISINYYAQVDFNSFEKLIDEIGGITVTLKTPMLADWNNNGNSFEVEPGTYTMPGSYVLAYARCRENCGDDQGDIGRGSRQMEVIQSIRDQILKFNMLPTLVAKAPALYKEVSSGVKTNMTLDQAIQLAALMMQIPKDNMKTYNMDYTDASDNNAIIDGTYQAVLVPNMDAIRKLRDEMFASQGSAAAPIVLGSSDPLTLALKENARIQILNGTTTSGLADTTATYLKGKGLNVVSTGNTDSAVYSHIIVSGATPYTVKYLASLMNITNDTYITNHYDPNATADVVVYLGNDWSSSNALSQ
jgi:LCP family protein required for cell wall assembly